MKTVVLILVAITLTGCGPDSAETRNTQIELPKLAQENAAEDHVVDDGDVNLGATDYNSIVSSIIDDAFAPMKSNESSDQGSPSKLKLVQPTEQEIAAFDEKFKQAQEATDLGVRDYAEGYNLLRRISVTGIKLSDFERLGYWFTMRPRSDLDLEKGAWLLLSSGSAIDYELRQRNSSAMNSKRTLHGGIAAARAAEYYANKASEDFNLSRALGLYMASGKAGIQDSYLKAGYIRKHWVQTPAQKKIGVDHLALKASTRNLFDFAQRHCDDERYFVRELHPWTEAGCTEARRQYNTARLAHDAIKPDYYDASFLARFSTTEARLLTVSGIVELGKEMAANYDPGDAKFENPDFVPIVDGWGTQLAEDVMWVQ